MTAVQPLPSFPSTQRSPWGSSNGNSQGSLDAMGAGEYSRLVNARKSALRTNSSSSLSSSASSSSTITQPAPQLNGVQQQQGLGGDLSSGWASRKKPSRGLWPSSKAEPTIGLTNRSQMAGSSSLSIPPSMNQPPSVLPSQHMQQTQQPNGPRIASSQGHVEGTAVLYLLPINGTFERKTITVPWFPEILRIGRQTNAKTVPTPLNGYFDSKVLSRQHAEIWADRYGKIFIRDVKSSNGTFVNGQRLSQENKDSDPHELREQDILELGIDIVSEDQKTVVHHKVAARVEHAGVYNNSNGNGILDLNFGDIDPSAGGGLMAPSLGQNMSQMRSRSSSQGSNNSRGSTSTAGTNMGGAGAQRQMNFWLTPITMEQIVKRLTSELKNAKQQSNDLHRTSEYFDNILTHNENPHETDTGNHGPEPILNGAPTSATQKTPFSDPPAPPPQQPLPEKPDVLRAGGTNSPSQPPLLRADTERQPATFFGNSSPKAETSSQIVSLIEALAAARKEIDSQGARVKDLEDLLRRERLARESAEERAMRLESHSKADTDAGEVQADSLLGLGEGDESLPREFDGGSTGLELTSDANLAKELDVSGKEKDVVDSNAEDSATRLQRKLDLMVLEMNEMKQAMEKYRRRMESAEEDSASSRKSLAAMIESIRKDEADRTTNHHPQGIKDGLSKGTTHNLGLVTTNGAAVSSGDVLKIAGVQNGKPLGPEDMIALDRAMSTALTASRSRHDHLVQAAPYASILGVVCIGVGLMALLNGWQRVEK